MAVFHKDNWEALMECLRKGEAPALIWLYGEDQGKGRSLLEELRSKFVPEPVRSFNHVCLDAREAGLERILEIARSLPMLSRYKLIVVYNASELRKSDLERSLGYFQAPCPSTCLVFWAQKPPQSEKLAKLLKEKRALVELRPRSESGAQAWVRDRVRQEGKDITAEAARALIQRVGTQEGPLEWEIQKLLAFVGQKRLIQDSDVEDVAAEARSSTLFELTDALSENRTAHALRTLHRILGQGTAPLAVVGMLARQLRLLLTAMSVKKGVPPPVELQVPDFVWERLLRQAAAWNETRLLTALRALMGVDTAMKSGRLDPEVLLDQWVIRTALTKSPYPRAKKQARTRG
jgi:DNA polymerase-3 subunit delta